VSLFAQLLRLLATNRNKKKREKMTHSLNCLTNEAEPKACTCELNGQPIKPKSAEDYEYFLNEFGRLYEEATNRLQWRGGLTALRRYSDTEDEQAQKFADTLDDLRNRIDLFGQALGNLTNANRLRLEGEPALYEYEKQLQNWHEQNRHRELFAEKPEAYTLHAIAVKKVIREAQLAKRVKWNSLENYYLAKAVYATVNGLTLDEVEEALDRHIEARQMSYTVSTKNLKMKVA
jgi:hypothetical protein